MAIRDVMAIANNIIKKSNDNGIRISNLKLQKMLYFAQGESYRENNEPLFSSELQAWQHGPVSPIVYSEYCFYGASPIPNPDDVQDLDECENKIIDSVIEKYGNMDVWDLVDLSHSQKPWKETYNSSHNGNVIDNDLIKEQFKKK